MAKILAEHNKQFPIKEYAYLVHKVSDLFKRRAPLISSLHPENEFNPQEFKKLVMGDSE